ncbi:MAG: hypothetical protein ACF8OB_14930 [Phycisphaeraceae bacterium JB051]
MFRTLTQRYIQSHKGILLGVVSLMLSLMQHFVLPLLDQQLPAINILVSTIGILILCTCISLFYLQAAPTIGTLKLMGARTRSCMYLFVGYTALLTLAGALIPAMLHSLFAWSIQPILLTLISVIIPILLASPILLSHFWGSPIRLIPSH